MKNNQKLRMRVSRLSLFIAYIKGLLKKELKSLKDQHQIRNAEEWMKEAEILACEIKPHEREYLVLDKEE